MTTRLISRAETMPGELTSYL